MEEPKNSRGSSQATARRRLITNKVSIADHNDEVKLIDEVVAKLYDNNHSVPLLVMFANKLLKLARDYFEDIRTARRQHMLSNFFQLFFIVAESGPEMKRYMIQQKFIGRLLDIYDNSKSTNKHYSRDLSYLPMYERIVNLREDDRFSSASDDDSIDAEEDIDFVLRFVPSKIKSDDLVVERNKPKKSKYKKHSDEDEGNEKVNTRETDDKIYTYLVRTICTLVCS